MSSSIRFMIIICLFGVAIVYNIQKDFDNKLDYIPKYNTFWISIKNPIKLKHNNYFLNMTTNTQENTISFPYYIDLVDSVPMESINMGEGLTSLIIQTSKSLLINKKEYEALIS